MEAGKSPIIEVRRLTKSFGTQRVLEAISLDVYPGEVMVVIGGSGCGKSTLLRHLIGSLPPDQGSIKMFGAEITTMSEAEINKIRKRFGVVFQSGALFNSLSVGENVALPLREHTQLDASTIETMVKIKLELVGLRQHLDKMPAMLSGGMKKRAGLARAIALDPQILFYDEPTSGLDPVTAAEIDQLIVDLTRKLNVTSMVVTHQMDSAFTIAHRMCMLDSGRILKIGPRQEFESLRGSNPDQLHGEQDRLVRQFLRGDAQGPITERRTAGGYEDDLLKISLRHDV
ncbi:MAG: ABC transporter ATP-binding protein [Planctomycetes bacterium]|nr:ABC transporter ATP-binding protein [Planctomycetota bacterium]